MFGWIRKAVYEKVLHKMALLELELKDSQLSTKVCRSLWYKSADELNVEKQKVISLQREIMHIRAAHWNDSKTKQSNTTQFTKDELRSLLQLVHPDKHDGKESAVKLTQKINQLRG